MLNLTDAFCVSDRSDRSDGSDEGPKGLWGVCEVELKNDGADFILFLGMKSVLFLLEGWGEWFLEICFIMIFLHWFAHFFW